ncbi:ATP-binding protein [Leptospira sp. WS39.C2]
MTTMRAKQIRFIGYLSILSSFLAIVNAVAMLLFFGITFFSFFGFFVALLFYFTYLLNQKGYHFLAKNIILIIFNFAVLNISSTQGVGSGSILLYFPLLSLYFLLFEAVDWKWIAYWTIISASGYLVLEFSHYQILSFGKMPDVNPKFLFPFNLFLSLFGEFLIMLVFIRVNHDLEKSYITKAEELNDSLRELLLAKEKAEKAAHSRSLFLSSMSHEIRTPINSIIGFTSLLLDDNPKEEQKNFLSMIDFSSKNLLVIINDILDFNRMEAGKVEIELIPFPFNALISNIYHSMDLNAKEKNLTLQLELDNKLPHYLVGDPTRLTQILFNLLSNAIKFTNKGEILFKIQLLENLSDQVKIKFSIKDTGIGIPIDKQEIIFEHFTQVDSSISRKFGGTGLGLSIVKKLIDLFGTTISLTSKEGEGSEFTFSMSFPISQVIPKSNEHLTSQTDVELRKNKIVLVVDDNELNLKVAYQFVKKCGYECKLASNGKEALQFLETDPISLVLMDLQMPDWDGFVTTQKIREKEIYTPIVALTADVSFDISNRVKESGFVDIIFKPFQPQDLIEKIEQYTM